MYGSSPTSSSMSLLLSSFRIGREGISLLIRRLRNHLQYHNRRAHNQGRSVLFPKQLVDSPAADPAVEVDKSVGQGSADHADHHQEDAQRDQRVEDREDLSVQGLGRDVTIT